MYVNEYTAISEGNGHSHQAELIDRICQLIKEKDDQVQVVKR